MLHLFWLPPSWRKATHYWFVLFLCGYGTAAAVLNTVIFNLSTSKLWSKYRLSLHKNLPEVIQPDRLVWATWVKDLLFVKSSLYSVVFLHIEKTTYRENSGIFMVHSFAHHDHLSNDDKGYFLETSYPDQFFTGRLIYNHTILGQ